MYCRSHAAHLGRKEVRSSLAGLTILMPPCKPMCGAWKKPTSAAHLYAPWCTVALASETRDLRICLSHCEEPCTLLKPLRIYSLNVYNNSVFGLLIIISKYYVVFILTIFPFLRLACVAQRTMSWRHRLSARAFFQTGKNSLFLPYRGQAVD